MTTIAEGAQAITAAIGVAKELIDVKRALNEAEFKLKIAELTSTLATAKIALADVQQELSKKDGEISELRKSFETRAELIEVRGFKYRRSTDGKPMGYGFCPRCELEKGKMLPLTTSNSPGRPYVCPSCKSEFRGDVTHYAWPDT